MPRVRKYPGSTVRMLATSSSPGLAGGRPPICTPRPGRNAIERQVADRAGGAHTRQLSQPVCGAGEKRKSFLRVAVALSAAVTHGRSGRCARQAPDQRFAIPPGCGTTSLLRPAAQPSRQSPAQPASGAYDCRSLCSARLSSCSPRFRSPCDAISAGARPKIMLVTTESRKANATMRRSNVICTERVSSRGASATSPSTAKYASRIPKPASHQPQTSRSP